MVGGTRPAIFIIWHYQRAIDGARNPDLCHKNRRRVPLRGAAKGLSQSIEENSNF